MSWNNETGGGGWKSGNGGGPWGQGPWGQGPGGGQQQPDLEEILKRSQDRLKKVMPGGGGGTGVPGYLWFLLFVVAAGVIGFYAFTFKVNPNQRGIVLRFGEYVRWEGPGLHFRFPYPVEEVLLPDVTRRNQTQIGMRTATGGRSGRTVSVRDVAAESLMLTGDENIVDVDFVVIWRVIDAEKYLFNIQNPDTTVKEVAESSMREVVGQSNIQPILTQARQKTETAVKELMQKTLDEYGQVALTGSRCNCERGTSVNVPRAFITGSSLSRQTAFSSRKTLPAVVSPQNQSSSTALVLGPG